MPGDCICQPHCVVRHNTPAIIRLNEWMAAERKKSWKYAAAPKRGVYVRPQDSAKRYALFREYYDQGLMDWQIANIVVDDHKLPATSAAVGSWRFREGLPSNYTVADRRKNGAMSKGRSGRPPGRRNTVQK